MKRIFSFLFALLLLTSAQGAYLPGTAGTLTIGGILGQRVFTPTEMSNLIIIGTAHASTSGRYNTLRKLNGSGGTGYQVTTGKTLTVEACIVYQGSATPASSVNFFYADNDSGNDSASTPTTPIYQFGDSSTAIGLTGLVANSGGSIAIFPRWTVPALKYVGFSPTGANMSIECYCLEN